MRFVLLNRKPLLSCNPSLRVQTVAELKGIVECHAVAATVIRRREGLSFGFGMGWASVLEGRKGRGLLRRC